MFYKARNPKTGNMWDVWIYHHKGTYFLYSLCNSGSDGWDNISMASSLDGVNWTEIGPVVTRDSGTKWMGTGSTWASPVLSAESLFQMNYSLWAGDRQTIFFAESDDLVHWTKRGRKSEFVQDERWYEPKGRWDCIWTIRRQGGGLCGYWTATPRKETGGRFGFGESLDGVTWKALEPPKVEGVVAGEGEVGAIERIGGKYYMLFGSYPVMRTLVADQPQGPFKAVERNPVFLGGHTYFARFVQTPSGLLVCHHSIARDGQVSMGLLKGTSFAADGTMRLTWWPGNEVLKRKPIAVAPPAAGRAGPVRMLGRRFDATAGLVLEGQIVLPEPLGAPCGLYVEHGRGIGTAILLGNDGRAELGQVMADGTGFKAEKTVDREMEFGAPSTFRLLLRGVLLEVYLDDVLIECYSLPGPATGRIGLITGSRSNSIGALRAWKHGPSMR